MNGQFTYVLDALQTVPGVTTNQNGAFGGQASVSIRGAGGDRTLVLFDGIELNDVSTPGASFNFANLDPHGVARIEVLRGPQSILYGSAAIGGVINILTPSGEEGFGGGAFVEGGSFATVRGGATVFGGTEKLSFNLSSSAARTDGISAADFIDGNTERDGYENVSVNGKLTARPTDTTRAELFFRYTDTRSEFDRFGPVDADSVSFVEQLAFAGRLHADLFDGRFRNTVTVSQSQTDRKNLSDGVQSFEAQGERFAVDYLGVFEVAEGWTVSGGAEHERTHSKTTDPRKFTINSVFGELGFTQVQGLTLTAGVRLDDHEAYGSVTTARVTGSYVLPGGMGTRLKANWGEGFRAPSVFQLTYICTFCGLTAPNQNLRPENSNAWEVGIEQFLFDDRVRMELTYFDQSINDMIIFTFTAGYDNVDRAKLQGVEVTFEADLTRRLNLTANYTYTRARDLGTGARLIRTPSHMAFARLQWQVTEKLLLGLKVLYNGKEADRGGAILDDWIRVDLTGSYALTEQLTLYARVDNLFDEQYQQIVGYGTPGISAYGGLRAAF